MALKIMRLLINHQLISFPTPSRSISLERELEGFISFTRKVPISYKYVVAEALRYTCECSADHNAGDLSRA